MSQAETEIEFAQTNVDAMIERHREFTKWMNKAKKFRTTGYNVGYIERYLKRPHDFDEYELKRAIEEGLA